MTVPHGANGADAACVAQSRDAPRVCAEIAQRDGAVARPVEEDVLVLERDGHVLCGSLESDGLLVSARQRHQTEAAARRGDEALAGRGRRHVPAVGFGPHVDQLDPLLVTPTRDFAGVMGRRWD